MKRYAIWNKVDPILTPVGEVFTAEKWIERYPIAGVASITVECAAGEINGGFFGTLGQMKQMCEAQGADFSACTTNEEILEAIEAFEDAQNAPSDKVSNEELTATSLASIAASMEYQNMLTLPDEEV
jgi:hypothetical protein